MTATPMTATPMTATPMTATPMAVGTHHNKPVTPRRVFLNRRELLWRMGLGGLACSIGGGCGVDGSLLEDGERAWLKDLLPAERNPRYGIPEQVERKAVTPQDVAAVHNNFYEFLVGRGGDLRKLTADFRTSPWSLQIDGACDRPCVLSLEDLRQFAHEERLYPFRCVERWAMNVPWTGFPLWRLLEQAAPRPEASWFVFESAADPASMPGLRATAHYPWPYREALRRDEAELDLAFIATGAYGEPLPKQHGAPLRLVVPWKYGYKGAKSIVRITCVEAPPTTFWHQVSPHEYGLLSNVNPNIPHPRWGQENSFWLRDDLVWPIGDDVFSTVLFNGYSAEVSHLYPDEPRTLQQPLRPGSLAR